ncbi:MAG: hypothetical protein LBR40_02030 [Bacilli bacterium]|nr:hypothetical protein [Bacilli bacterium]
MAMTKNSRGKQDSLIMYTLDQLVPRGHLVRKMERHLDLTFIYDEVAHLYSNVGQKSLDPVVFSKFYYLKICLVLNQSERQ